MSNYRRRLMGNLDKPKITTIRINQNISDPATMITRIVDEGGIEAIRANSHRYVGVFDSAANLMSLRQLDDNDGTKYLNGTAAPITTLGNDVWMKLPQFYWKCEEYATDIWDFSVAYGGKPDDSYKEWDGKDLIGAYEAYRSSSKLYSISGLTSTGSVSLTNFKTYSRNRGDGFTLVKWKHHCMMAMLFYAMYNHTNSQEKLGSGADILTKKTGCSNVLCMSDSSKEGSYANFWGLENWWGNRYEWVDNVIANVESFTITEDDNSMREVSGRAKVDGIISKLKFGENLDIMPVETLASENTGFCDIFQQKSSGNRVAIRSYGYTGGNGGVAYLNTNNLASNSNLGIGSRLAFRGEIVIEP